MTFGGGAGCRVGRAAGALSVRLLNRTACLLTSGSSSGCRTDAWPGGAMTVRRSTSLDLAAGVTTKSSAARLRAELGHAPARVLARSLLPVGLNWQWATSSRWLPQRVKNRSARILLAHHGAVRRRDAIVRAGGSGSATASAAPRSGPGGSTFGRAESRPARSARSARHAQNSAWSRPG